MEYEAIIGLEVHAQLLTKSKIFCSCSTEFGALPNTHTCPLCLGLPGALPVLNRKAVELACKVALATNCNIVNKSIFARKNYFYPDLPKGYQISQYELPLAKGGYINIEGDKGSKTIRINRIHLEEDAGKNLHGEGNIGVSYVDLNRAGTPLIEIVSEADIRSSLEATNYLKTLRLILLYLEVCDGNMEEGSFRCDANVSIRVKGEHNFGTKVEIKNLNSFKFIQKALDYEIKRQEEVIENGGKVIQETRLWDSEEGKTFSMRGKEESHDYRYFPEPDLITLQIDEKWLNEIKATLPELPQERKNRFINDYSIPPYDAEILVNYKKLGDYFEECVKIYNKPKILSNWIMGELLKELNNDGKEISDSPLTPLHLTQLLSLIDKGVISGKIAKTVFEKMYKSGKLPSKIIEDEGLVQITDEKEIEEKILQIISSHPKEVKEYKEGKIKVFGFFVGEVMKETKGKANPKIVNELLKKFLN